jgi:D-beta-D-heptose 7-phosphate kinase/D-beta-D-heptose 1-phosphate adenosyltransferase
MARQNTSNKSSALALSRARLVQIVEAFHGKRVSVVGDIMLDRFIYGRAERISQEAPVPVLEYIEESYCLGGAANVAAHMLSVGATANLVGLVGKDVAGAKLRELMRERGMASAGLITDTDRPTTEKTRVVAGGQQIVRLDKESCKAATAKISEEIIKAVLKNVAHSDALIFVDYGKGSLTPRAVSKILAGAKKQKIPILVNPKNQHQIFKGATLFTPNEKEAFDMTGEYDNSRRANILQKALGGAVLITEGSRGMTLYQASDSVHFDAVAREVFDEAGASDTVTATAAIALAAGANMVEAVYLANMAAGIVVGKRGVAVVESGELLQAIAEDDELK